MEATFSNLHLIAPDEITDLRMLRKLAREGRLYLDTSPSVSHSYDVAVDSALAYISQIDSYACPHALPFLPDLWRTILTHPQLNDKLIIQKGPHEGELNRYRLMYLVSYMLEAGIYEGVSALQLHHVLEHTKEKDAIYRGQMLYAMERSQLRILRGIVTDFFNNLLD